MAEKKRKRKSGSSKVKAAGEALALAAPAVTLASKPAGLALGVMAKGLSLLSKVMNERSERWWKAFLEECARRERMSLAEMRRKLEARMESDPAMREVILQHAQQVLDAASDDCLPILGMLSGAYHAEGQRADGFYCGFAELLMQCSDSDLASVREFVGRCVCVKPEMNSRTLQLEMMYMDSDKACSCRIAQIELEKPGSVTVQSILGGEWTPKSDWKRVSELLGRNTLALREGPWKVIVYHDDMKRMQSFLKLASVAEGRYTYGVRSAAWRVAELERFPHCFGYGETADDAVEMMRGNMAMFVDDHATAQLVKV